jgi:Domain of unknown function (DUF4271)
MNGKDIFTAPMLKYFVLLVAVFAAQEIWSQDSLPARPTDTVRRTTPAQIRPVRRQVVVEKTPVRNFLLPDSTIIPKDTFNIDSLVLSDHPYFRFKDPIRYSITIKKWEGKETIFYSIIALLLLFALIKNSFRRYVSDLFKIFFRTTVKQRQIKEQMVQSPLPSLLLNIFYLLSGGMFLAILLHHFSLGLDFSFWELYFYSVIALIAIYGVKFLTLKLLGWIFQVPGAIDGYIFIVFTTNKVIGMALVPVLVILALTTGPVKESAITLSILIVIGLFFYRFYLSYSTLNRQINISVFHFVLYLCAFEIAPLLLINKLLFRFLGETS